MFFAQNFIPTTESMSTMPYFKMITPKIIITGGKSIKTKKWKSNITLNIIVFIQKIKSYLFVWISSVIFEKGKKWILVERCSTQFNIEKMLPIVFFYRKMIEFVLRWSNMADEYAEWHIWRKK